MLATSYPNGTYQDTPHTLRRDDRPYYADTTRQDAEVLAARNIPPHIAAAAGVRSVTAEEARNHGHRALAGLLIPSFNTQGEVDRYQLRPHNPPVDDKGRPRKYLWPTGSRQSLYVPLQCMDALRDVNAPLIITEAPLKALATVAALEAEGIDGVAVVAVAGVYGWRSGDMPLSDHGDIPMKRREGERITYRRKVYLAFDSDALTNPNVSRARWEYAQFLRRRGAKVRYIEVPPATDGGKQGIDDALAAGITLRTMVKSATPAPDIMPALDTTTAADDEVSEIERLRTENESLRQLVSAQARLITNPLLKDKERAVGYRIITLANQRKRAGDVGTDGRPRLRASDVANDYRSRPAKGEALPETNPDGSRPITRRQNVKTIVKALTDAGVLAVGTEPTTRTAANGDRYADTDLVVDVEDTTAAIVKLADYRIEKTRKPYTRQEPCPHCGEVHERTVIRQTFCGTEDDPGCGAVLSETVVTLPVPPANDPNITEEQRVDLEEQTAARPESASPKNGEAKRDGYISSPSPAPRIYSSPKNGEPAPRPMHLTYTQPSPKNGEAMRYERKPDGVCIEDGCANQVAPASPYYCTEHGGRAEVPA